jgi:hypothetical protein
MHVDEIYHLAQTVHALLPQARVAPAEPWDADVQSATSDRIAAACEAAGIDRLGSLVLGETIAGYLGGWGTRWGNLDGYVEAGLTALNHQAGGAGAAWGVHLVPEGALGVAHVACLIDWWLCREANAAEGPEVVDDDAALRQYTFDVGNLSRDYVAVTVRLGTARVRLLLRDLKRLLAVQPERDVELLWLGALRREAHAP